MGLLTRNTKMMAPYQQWVAADITNGDILDVLGSIGKAANSVTIESIGGQTTLRFNVCHKIYKEYDHSTPWGGLGKGLARPRPLLIDEVEIVQPNIIIEANETWTIEASEINIVDIKIITKSAGLKITVT